MKAPGVAAHKAGTDLRRLGVHTHPTCGEGMALVEIVAQRAANPCLSPLSMMSPQRVCLSFRLSFHDSVCLNFCCTSPIENYLRALKKLP